MENVLNAAKSVARDAAQVLPAKFRDTAFVRLLAWRKIPMLAYVRPIVEELTDERCVVRIPLRRRTQNHLGSMYFGALSVGADCSGGLAAMRQIVSRGNRVSLVFKDFRADFLKRPDADVLFVNTEGQAIAAAVKEALDTGERVNMPVHVRASTVDAPDVPVAEFVLTLSLKRR